MYFLWIVSVRSTSSDALKLRPSGPHCLDEFQIVFSVQRSCKETGLSWDCSRELHSYLSEPERRSLRGSRRKRRNVMCDSSELNYLTYSRYGYSLLPVNYSAKLTLAIRGCRKIKRYKREAQELDTSWSLYAFHVFIALTLAGTSHFAILHGWYDPPARLAPNWARASRKKRAYSSPREEADGTQF